VCADDLGNKRTDAAAREISAAERVAHPDALRIPRRPRVYSARAKVLKFKRATLDDQQESQYFRGLHYALPPLPSPRYLADETPAEKLESRRGGAWNPPLRALRAKSANNRRDDSSPAADSMIRRSGRESNRYIY